MATIQIIVPSAVNLLTAMVERIIADRLNGQTSSLSLPNLHRRAAMIVNETGVIALTQEDPNDSSH